MIWTAVETVITIFIMIAAGIFISWKKWVTAKTVDIFPKIIINVAMPCMIVSFFSDPEYITRQGLIDSWLPLLIVFTVVPVTFFLGKLAAVIFRIPKTRRGVFAALFSFSNSIFIGIPVATALFGGGGDTAFFPFVIYYYLANTTFFWTLGFYSIRRDADAISGSKIKIGFNEVIKKLISPPIITLIIMFLIVFSGVTLPALLVTTAKDISGLITPLSLMFMGCLIYSYGKKCVGFEKDLVPVLLGRYIIAPGLLFAACMLAKNLFGGQFGSVDPILMRNVFTVQAGLPAMTSVSIVAGNYGADSGFATKSFFWTTAVSLVTIPAYMLLFSFMG
jgi:malate permease and related proteins